MKRRLLGSVALPALLASPAFAADMPVKAPPPPPAVYSWAGFYAGLNAGGAWGRSDAETSVSCGAVPGFANYFCNPAAGQANAAAVNAAGTGSMSGSGFTGGGQVGFNYQIQRVVLGLEADSNYTGLSGSRTATAIPPVGPA